MRSDRDSHEGRQPSDRQGQTGTFIIRVGQHTPDLEIWTATKFMKQGETRAADRGSHQTGLPLNPLEIWTMEIWTAIKAMKQGIRLG